MKPSIIYPNLIEGFVDNKKDSRKKRARRNKKFKTQVNMQTDFRENPDFVV